MRPINTAFDGFFAAVQTKATDKGVVLFSRPKYSRDNLFAGFNPLVNPNHEQKSALQRLKDQLTREADRAQVSAAGIERITLQSVPDAYTGFVRSIERLFGVRIQFVRAEGLPEAIEFTGGRISQLSGGHLNFIAHNSIRLINSAPSLFARLTAFATGQASISSPG